MDVQQQDRSLSPKRGDDGVQMNYRGFVVATGLLAALVAVALAGNSIMAQTPAEADAFTTPRTPWGVPDLQGIWSPGYILTPLERPDEFADKEFLTMRTWPHSRNGPPSADETSVPNGGQSPTSKVRTTRPSPGVEKRSSRPGARPSSSIHRMERSRLPNRGRRWLTPLAAR